MNYVKISFRSLILRWRQYISLFFVCALGTGISLSSLFLINGMLSALSNKAKIYYGGDLQFLGGNRNLEFPDSREFIQKISALFPADAVVSPRFDFDAATSAFYYEGVGVRQRIIKGIDFSREQELFSKFNYIEGSAAEMAETNGVLLSEGIARMLEVSCGDSITFMLMTAHGYTNTVQLIVKGIFQDSSVFGLYTSYVDIGFLRSAFSAPEFFANRIGIFFPETGVKKSAVPKYQKLLETQFTMYRLVDDKYEFYNELLGGKLESPTYALIPLDANMEELRIVIDAMKIITAFVIITLILIIVVGISSTYRVIVMKRINEIGIYKAIGMERTSVIMLLLSETAILLAAGCACGLGLCAAICLTIQKFTFAFIPAFDIFLTDGHIIPLPDPAGTTALFAIVIVTTVSAVMFSVWKAIKITPVQALGITE